MNKKKSKKRTNYSNHLVEQNKKKGNLSYELNFLKTETRKKID